MSHVTSNEFISIHFVQIHVSATSAAAVISSFVVWKLPDATVIVIVVVVVSHCFFVRFLDRLAPSGTSVDPTASYYVRVVRLTRLTRLTRMPRTFRSDGLMLSGITVLVYCHCRHWFDELLLLLLRELLLVKLLLPLFPLLLLILCMGLLILERMLKRS